MRVTGDTFFLLAGFFIDPACLVMYAKILPLDECCDPKDILVYWFGLRRSLPWIVLRLIIHGMIS
jgi:hypothetical protein